VLLVAFCVLAVTGAGRAQASGPLAALEQQRVLAARILAAQASGDLFTAALLYAQVADLEHVVAMPFTRGDPREAIAEQARDLLERHVKLTALALANDRDQRLGKPCRKCQGRAFKICRRCDGKGYRQVRVGRRMRKMECKAWDPCGVCDASGRLATVPQVHESLQRLVVLAGKHAVKKDVFGGLKAMQANVRDIPPGLSVSNPKGQVFRKVVGPPPVNPDRIKDKSRLKGLWLNSLPEERRDFLFQFALDAATVAHGLRFLEGLSDPPSAMQVRKEARSVTLEDLQWRGTALAGRFVTLEVTGRKPDSRFLDAVSFPLKGRIAIDGVDPTMVLAFCYTEDDLLVVRNGSRQGLLKKADRSLRNYAPRIVAKQLREIGPGKPLRIWGRVLKHPDGVPAVLLEVWSVAEPGGDQDK